MNQMQKLWLDAISDFVMTSGGVLVGGILEQTGSAQIPGPATWLLSGILGLIAGFKQIKARLAEPVKKLAEPK